MFQTCILNKCKKPFLEYFLFLFLFFLFLDKLNQESVQMIETGLFSLCLDSPVMRISDEKYVHTLAFSAFCVCWTCCVIVSADTIVSLVDVCCSEQLSFPVFELKLLWNAALFALETLKNNVVFILFESHAFGFYLAGTPAVRRLRFYMEAGRTPTAATVGLTKHCRCVWSPIM